MSLRVVEPSAQVLTTLCLWQFGVAHAQLQNLPLEAFAAGTTSGPKPDALPDCATPRENTKPLDITKSAGRPAFFHEKKAPSR
ncbi:MAG: hypothetical protein CL676_13945 [Bdellovibrionaceae bacterium]|nr:hypothetical protein [Pseudobdellovibrionaceae bacterium]|tara:strand:+ start:593 stop:841 length:249 start_codon:yes stop_codon:yes gene_type:complete